MNYVARAMMASTDEDRDMWTDVETIRMYVSKAIMCPYTGVVLDTFTAVVLEMTGPDGNPAGSAIVDGKAWDAIAATTLPKLTANGATVRVLDGRTFRAKVKAAR